jgi:hypothetical protein
MAYDTYSAPVRAGGPSFRAWLYLIAGAVLVIVGAVLPGADKGELNAPRAVLFGAGLISVAAAVVRRFRTTPDGDIEARIGTAGFLVTAGALACLTYLGTPDRLLETVAPGQTGEREWDSARMVLAVLAIASMAGALLVILPVVARKVVVSLLVLLHFGNILVSVTSVPPPNGPAPWLSTQAWAYFYRPYGSFMYLNNAYHFYSPEPGPPTLAWFYVRYTDESGRWIKLPSRKDSPVPMHYQRLLALTESINAIDHNIPPNYNELLTQRNLQAAIVNKELVLDNTLPPNMAYNPPLPYSRVMASRYAHHVAVCWPHPDDNPGADVKTVKVYRLIHKIVTAPELVAGANPDDEVFDYPYFMGEFRPDGEMINPNDPFLYWLLPITREAPPGSNGPVPDSALVLKNRLEMHARARTADTEKEPRP